MILSFDTSCDDTSVAVLKDDRSYSNIVSSQNEIHEKFGGIMPEIAARNHIQMIYPLTEEAIKKADVAMEMIDYIAVTTGPGLMPSLLVGVSFAKALAYAHHKPVIGVNHIEGHIFAPFINRALVFPFVALVVSGGHTHLFFVKGVGNYELLGKTLDDAAGEAFDKVARVLNIGYPGGPVIDRLSKQGNSYRFNFPKGLSGKNTLNFSFSGVKTAVNNLVKKMQNLSKTDVIDIAASFQRSVVDVLCEKTQKACTEKGVKNLVLSGGVSANSLLRESFKIMAEKNGLTLFMPDAEFSTDNALMIAKVASLRETDATCNYDKIEADPRSKIY